MDKSKIEKMLKKEGFESTDLEHSFYLLGKTRDTLGANCKEIAENFSSEKVIALEKSGLNLVFLLKELQTRGILDYSMGTYRINKEYS